MTSLEKVYCLADACTIVVDFEIGHLSNTKSEYVATDTVTKSSSIVINSDRGLLHKASLQITGPSSIKATREEDAYLVLKLAEQLVDSNVEPIDPLDRSLMEFVQTEAILTLPEDDIVALVVPTCAGPLSFRSSRKDMHSSDRGTTKVFLMRCRMIDHLLHCSQHNRSSS